jgi:protoheme IX farnesyltransferase
MNLVGAYFELTKPRLTILAVLATWVGARMAVQGSLPPSVLWGALLGAALVGGGGNALNEWLEAEPDAQMARTRSRPLPSGRVSSVGALLFGGACSVVGVAVLFWSVNPLTGWLGLATLVSYVGLYTPLKRVTSLCTLVGAIPGAMPPLIGWAAARGSLALEAWVLFALVFVWQLPHFLAIGWVHRADYARAGFRILSVVDPEGCSTARHMVLYGVALLPISVLPAVLKLSGPFYCFGAIAVGAWFLSTAVIAARARALAPASRVFLASLGYLPTVLLLLVLDRPPL